MRLSLSVRVTESFSNKRVVRIPLSQLAEIASNAGYDALCLRASMLGIHDSSEKLEEVKEIITSHHLAVSMVTGDFAVPENGDDGAGKNETNEEDETPLAEHDYELFWEYHSRQIQFYS